MILRNWEVDHEGYYSVIIAQKATQRIIAHSYHTVKS